MELQSNNIYIFFQNLLQDDAGLSQVPVPDEPSAELMRQASRAALDLAKGADKPNDDPNVLEARLLPKSIQHY